MFVSFLLCCYELKIFCSDDMRALGCFIFPKYTELVRKLLIHYRMEPAGSHGAWGLDDYFFLPFYWGSAQLIEHKFLTPMSIHDEHLVRIYKTSYMYFASIAFILQVKASSLNETAPILSSISQICRWEKINSGLMKMYQV
jgi:serine/threonine-protein phosphatase 2A activator